jgi:hypothetical protein
MWRTEDRTKKASYLFWQFMHRFLSKDHLNGPLEKPVYALSGCLTIRLVCEDQSGQLMSLRQLFELFELPIEWRAFPRWEYNLKNWSSWRREQDSHLKTSVVADLFDACRAVLATNVYITFHLIRPQVWPEEKKRVEPHSIFFFYI